MAINQNQDLAKAKLWINAVATQTSQPKAKKNVAAMQTNQPKHAVAAEAAIHASLAAVVAVSN